VADLEEQAVWRGQRNGAGGGAAGRPRVGRARGQAGEAKGGSADGGTAGQKAAAGLWRMECGGGAVAQSGRGAGAGFRGTT
ncbi:hypothetical protein KI387_042446, partial [Taxus chinensis]